MLSTFLRRVVKGVARSSRRDRRTAKPAVRFRYRPWIESIEDRTLLSTVTWINPGSGDWRAAANWSDGTVNRLPGPADDVVINPQNAGAVITHASGTDSVHSLTVANAATLTVSGTGSLSVLASSMLDASTTLNLAGGSIGGNGTWTINGPLNWTGGSMSGTGTVNANGGLTLNSTSGVTEAVRTFNDNGNTTWTAGSLTLANRTVFNNTGTFTVHVNASILGSGAQATFNNAGSLVRSSDNGTTSIAAQFNNSGAVDVQTGTLQLTGGGTDSGAFTVDVVAPSPPATLSFAGGRTLLTATSSISGADPTNAGQVLFAGTSSASVEVDGTYALAGPQSGTTFTGGNTSFPGTVAGVGSTLTISGTQGPVADFVGNSVSTATANLSAGSLGGLGDVSADTVTWSGTYLYGRGSTTVNVGLTITGGTKTLDGRTLNIGPMATANWIGGDMDLRNGAVINNFGTFNVQTNGSLSTSGPLSTFNNMGSFNQVVNNGTTTIAALFNNSGAVDVQTGTLQLTGGGTDSGAFTVDVVAPSPPATLSFAGGRTLLTASSSISGADPTNTGQVVFGGTSSASVEVDGTYALAGPQSATTFTGGNTSFPGTVASIGSTLTVNGSQGPVADFLNNSVSTGTANLSAGSLGGLGDISADTVTWSGTYLYGRGSTTVNVGLTITGGTKTLDGRTLNIGSMVTANWTGNGRIDLTNGAVINNAGTFNVQTTQSPGLSGDATSAFNNAGTFTKVNSSDQNAISAAFNNAGTVQAESGTLAFSGGGLHTGSFLVAGGNLTFGGAHEFDPGSAVTGTSGAVSFTAGSDNFYGSYNYTGGATTVAANTAVYFWTDASTGNFSNAGYVLISPGITLTAASYTQSSGSETDLIDATLSAPVNINGGTFWGSGTINGNVTNASTLNLGYTSTPGSLTINGNYTQAHTATLAIKVGADSAGDGYDQLNITGTAALDGTLSISLLYGYSPPVGSNFTILTFGALDPTHNRFSTVSQGNAGFSVNYDPTDVTLSKP